MQRIGERVRKLEAANEITDDSMYVVNPTPIGDPVTAYEFAGTTYPIMDGESASVVTDRILDDVRKRRPRGILVMINL